MILHFCATSPNVISNFAVMKSDIIKRVHCYRVIAPISVKIVPTWDIKGRELASVRRSQGGFYIALCIYLTAL